MNSDILNTKQATHAVKLLRYHIPKPLGVFVNKRKGYRMLKWWGCGKGRKSASRALKRAGISHQSYAPAISKYGYGTQSRLIIKVPTNFRLKDVPKAKHLVITDLPTPAKPKKTTQRELLRWIKILERSKSKKLRKEAGRKLADWVKSKLWTT